MLFVLSKLHDGATSTANLLKFCALQIDLYYKNLSENPLTGDLDRRRKMCMNLYDTQKSYALERIPFYPTFSSSF